MGGPESESEEIMKSWKEIKSEGNQGVKMRGQQGARRPWMKGKWDQDKEVQKTKRRCDSSKEIKDHLHFGFLSAFTVIIALWRQTPAPTQNDTNREWVILTNWAAGAKRILFRLKRGLQTVGSPMAGQRYNCNWLLYSPFPNLQPQGATSGERERARTDCHNSEILCNHESRISDWNVMCTRQNNMGNSSVILSRSQKT